MHSFGIALLPPDVTDVRGRIRELIAPYDAEREVAPYRYFHSAEYTRSMARYHGAGNDLELLVRTLRAKGFSDVGLEESHLYRIATYNPRGKWDYWLVGGNYNRKVYNERTARIGRAKGWDESLCANICLVSRLPADVAPAILITPIGEWHACEDFGWRMISPAEDKDRAWAAWEAHVRPLLRRYPHHFSVGLDIHS